MPPSALMSAMTMCCAVVCGACRTPLRSSWSTGCRKRYAYYLCQTKTWEAYGKSIPRDTLEAEVGDIVKTLQPTQGLMTLAKAVFRHIWEARRDQAKDVVASGKREILRIEKEIECVLDRIMTASNDTIIRRYEDKVECLERQKALLMENTAKQIEPKGALDEKLELACQFLAIPWKIWENGATSARRLVLKPAFTTPIEYTRKEGARTPNLSLPFKALKDVPAEPFCCGAGGGT